MYKQEWIIKFKNSMKPRVFEPDNTLLPVFLSGFKSADIDQLILALFLDLGLFWSKKLDVKFTHVFIRYKNTH